MTGVQEGDHETKEDVSEGGVFHLPEKPLPIPGDALPPGFNDAGELREGGMRPKLLPNGNLLIPMRAESDDGRLIGDGMIECGTGHARVRAVDSLPASTRPSP